MMGGKVMDPSVCRATWGDLYRVGVCLRCDVYKGLFKRTKYPLLYNIPEWRISVE